MILRPYKCSRADRYCRLLPPFTNSGDPAELAQRLQGLANAMHQDLEQRPRGRDSGHPAGRELIPAGYTYFGQFIMHDLTSDDTPLRLAGLRPPEEIINYSAPRLDLDGLYGGGPGSASHGNLYDGNLFRIGTATTASGARFDVPFVDDEPAVADPRNCENAILRQVHAMFLLLHNVAVEELRRNGTREEVIFETARSRVRWQFQWLVRNDFLRAVCNSAVFDAVLGGSHLMHWPAGEFSIPVEFAHAGARFGHSLVRNSYRLRNDSRLFSLAELFGSDPPVPLAADLAVNWLRFTRPRGEPASELDTSLVQSLRALPDDRVHLYVTSPMPHNPHALAERTLSRGAAMGLPTGQQMRVALGATSSIPDDDQGWEILCSHGFEDETPLWYYVLLEAEVNEGGRCLGEIGSRIVAEVIDAALRHDRESFLFLRGGNWTPPPWPTPQGGRMQIQNLHDLALVVGLD